MEITLQVRRIDPDADEEPYLQSCRVEAEANDRVLDALIHVKHHIGQERRSLFDDPTKCILCA